MREPRRARFEVLCDVLKAIRDKKQAPPTHIMYQSRLSWAVLDECLGALLEFDMIETVELPMASCHGNIRREYKLTDKGYLTLTRYEALIESFAPKEKVMLTA